MVGGDKGCAGGTECAPDAANAAETTRMMMGSRILILVQVMVLKVLSL